MEYDRIWDFVSNFVPIQKSKFGMFEEWACLYDLNSSWWWISVGVQMRHQPGWYIDSVPMLAQPPDESRIQALNRFFDSKGCGLGDLELLEEQWLRSTGISVKDSKSSAHLIEEPLREAKISKAHE